MVKEGNSLRTRKLVFLSIFVAMGTVISPILRVEGMAPMQHFINVICAVFMGPWYALLNACLISFLRMTLMGIPPLAITGSVFGAVLSGLFYRWFKNSLGMAVLGEIIGTGIIGSMLSYPVMSFLMGKGGLSLFYYTPKFIMGTLIGGSIAYIFLLVLKKNGQLNKIKNRLEE